MSRVTDFRVDRIEIAEERYWELPAETRRLFELYARPVPSERGILAFELALWRTEFGDEWAVPVYRWEEIEASMRRLPHAD